MTLKPREQDTGRFIGQMRDPLEQDPPPDLDECFGQFGGHGSQPSQAQGGTKWAEPTSSLRAKLAKAVEIEPVVSALRIEGGQRLGHVGSEFPKPVEPQGTLVAGKFACRVRGDAPEPIEAQSVVEHEALSPLAATVG